MCSGGGSLENRVGNLGSTYQVFFFTFPNIRFAAWVAPTPVSPASSVNVHCCLSFARAFVSFDFVRGPFLHLPQLFITADKTRV